MQRPAAESPHNTPLVTRRTPGSPPGSWSLQVETDSQLEDDAERIEAVKRERQGAAEAGFVDDPATDQGEHIPRVRADPKKATAEDLYHDLEEVYFPEERIKTLLGPATTTQLEELQNALQLPFATVLLAKVSMAALGIKNTTSMYTKMLGVPPLPWPAHLGRTGDGKSLVVWELKQIALELQTRENRRRKIAAKGSASKKPPADEGLEVAAPQPPAEDEEPDEADEEVEVQKYVEASLTADTGTVIGWGPKVMANNGRLLVALHEGKILLSKVMRDQPGCDGQTLNKLYDRDEFSNTVLTAGSKFSCQQPWVLLWLAMHLEDIWELFSGGKDPLGIFNRFDWFARKGCVADLEDYADLEVDDSITFWADVVEIIDAQFPDIRYTKRRREPAFSMRTGLWRIYQDSEYFRESFNAHSANQRAAKARGDQRVASFESKVKTKECRYSNPIDALCKGVEQKVALEKFRRIKLDETAAAGRTKAHETWLYKSILDVRLALLAAGQRDVARELGVTEQWPLAIDPDHAEVGNLLTAFLGESTSLCQLWLQGRHESNAPAADTATPAAIKLLEGADLDAAFLSVPAPQVRKAIQTITMSRYQVFKHRDVRRKVGAAGIDTDVALSILVCAGLIRVFPAKRAEGKGGVPSTLFAKRPKPDDSAASLEIANALRILGVANTAAFWADSIDPCVGSLTDLAVVFPEFSAGALHKFADSWRERLNPSGFVATAVRAVSSAAGSAASVFMNTLSPAKRQQSEAGLEEMPPAKRPCNPPQSFVVNAATIATIKAHFVWICSKTKVIEIKQAYIKQRITGYEPERNDWQVLEGTLGALGIIAIATGGASTGKFTFVKPQSQELVDHVCIQVRDWLSLSVSEAKVGSNTEKGGKNSIRCNCLPRKIGTCLHRSCFY